MSDPIAVTHISLSWFWPIVTSITSIGLFVLGLLHKANNDTLKSLRGDLKDLEKKWEESEENQEKAFAERQQTLIAHMDKLIEAQGYRMNAMDERMSNMMKAWADCRHDHDQDRVRHSDLDKIDAKLEQIFSKINGLAQSVAAHHATHHQLPQNGKVTP